MPPVCENVTAGLFISSTLDTSANFCHHALSDIGTGGENRALDGFPLFRAFLTRKVDAHVEHDHTTLLSPVRKGARTLRRSARGRPGFAAVGLSPPSPTAGIAPAAYRTLRGWLQQRERISPACVQANRPDYWEGNPLSDGSTT